MIAASSSTSPSSVSAAPTPAFVARIVFQRHDGRLDRVESGAIGGEDREGALGGRDASIGRVVVHLSRSCAAVDENGNAASARPRCANAAHRPSKARRRFCVSVPCRALGAQRLRRGASRGFSGVSSTQTSSDK